MADVIGRGVIEVSADATKLRAGIDEAKKSINSLGIASEDATKRQSASIDKYIKQLGVAAVTTSKTTRETELYKLGLRGASDAQLAAANSALKLTEGYEKRVALGDQIKAGFVTLAAVGVTALIATYAAFDQLVKKAGEFQDLSETTGASAEGLASIAVAAAVAGVSMNDVAGATIKLTKNLTGVDDESKAAGAALGALGIKVSDFKKLDPVGQFDAVAKALSGFADGAGKTAVAVALYGKAGAEQLKVFKAVEDAGGRQVILTAEQIQQADDYGDKQAKVRAELTLHASVIATRMLPVYTAFTEALTETVKELAGVTDAGNDLANDNKVEEFAASTATALAVLADLAFRVGQTFHYIGDNIGAAAAQAVAIGSLDFSGAAAIGRASQESNERMNFSLGLADKLEERLAKISNRGAFGGAMKQSQMGSWDTVKEKPALKFNGVDPKGKDTAAKEAKAQLALDLETIKNTYGALTANFGNAEKIMQAMHAAGLVDEQDYYASKLGFLNLNSDAQEKDLAEQIARMEKENLIGKDLLDNQKKIAEARAKLATTKAANTAGAEVNTIQSTAALTKRASEVDAFFRETEAAAKARDIASVEAIRQSLLTQQEIEMESYAARLTALTIFDAARVEGEASVNAQIEREKQRHEDSMAAMKIQSDQMVLSAVTASTDQMYGLLKQAGLEQTALGKVAFVASKALAVAQIILSTNVAAAAALSLPPIGLGPVAGLPLSGFITAMGYSSAAVTAALAIASLDKGTDFVPRDMIAQIHKGEAIIPAAQNSGRNGGDMKLTIVNNTSARIGKVTEQTLPNGERALIIEEAVAATAAHLSDPNSKTSRAMSRNFALQRSR